jgi:DNA excision repair protein ERCC-4
MPATKTKTRPQIAILVDDREKLPFAFVGCTPINPAALVTIERTRLPEGDYSLWADLLTPKSSRIAIERKSLADLYHSATSERMRLEDEFQRLSEYGYAAIVIEADWRAIYSPNEHLKRPTETVPKSVVGTLIAWSQRFGVHVWACPSREFAEKTTFRMLERWARDHQ